MGRQMARQLTRIGNTGACVCLALFGAALFLLPACQSSRAPSTTPPAWSGPIAWSPGTQQGEVTVRGGETVEVRYKRAYQSPPRVVLVELRGANAAENLYSKDDFKIVGQEANRFLVQNNHYEHGDTWATVRWRAEGELAVGPDFAKDGGLAQYAVEGKVSQVALADWVKKSGGKLSVDPNPPPEDDVAIRTAERSGGKSAAVDVTLTASSDPRVARGTIVSLDLHRTKVTDADLAQLVNFKHLHTLNLYGTAVTDEGLKSLAAMPNLQTLYLSSTRITDAGLQQLQGLTKIGELGLNRTAVTDQGLAYLRGMTGLHSLSLAGTSVTDQGVSQLKAFRSLKHVELDRKAISKAAVQDLKRSLPRLQVIQ